MAEHAAHFVASSGRGDSAEDTLHAMFDLMASNPAFVRIIAHLLLSGHSPEEFVSEEGGARLLVRLRVQETAGTEDEAKLVAATGTAFTMGWLFFESFVLRAVSYEGDVQKARWHVQHTIEQLLLAR